MAYLWRDRVLIPLDVRPGETVHQDVIVPRTRLGEVRIEWLGPERTEPLAYELFLRTDAGLLSAKPPRSVLLRVGEQEWTPPISTPIVRFPAGRRILTFSGDDYCGSQESNSGALDTTFVLDRSASGSVSGRVTRPDGSPAAGAPVRLLHPAVAEFWHNHATPEIGDCGSRKTDHEGGFRFPQVAPGDYVVSTPSRTEPVFVPTVVHQGKGTQAYLTAEKPWPPSRGTLPLREE